jgi:hypothetical protein
VKGVLFQPTEEQRRTAKAMAGFGVPQEDIATFLGIDAKTLRKHFRAELDRGTIEANVKVAQTLFNMATVDKNVAAAIFWMKARAGWREKHLPEGDQDSAPPEPTTVTYRWANTPEPRSPTPLPPLRQVTHDIDDE